MQYNDKPCWLVASSRKILPHCVFGLPIRGFSELFFMKQISRFDKASFNESIPFFPASLRFRKAAKTATEVRVCYLISHPSFDRVIRHEGST